MDQPKMETKTIVLWRGEEKKHSWVYVNKEQGISGFYFPKKIVGESNPPLKLEMTIKELA